MRILIRIGVPDSSPVRLLNQWYAVYARNEITTPASRPPAAVWRKLSEASAREKLPVNAAATAKRKQTRPEASLRSASPSRMCMSLAGIGVPAEMADTETASVGERMAATAKATESGIA